MQPLSLWTWGFLSKPAGSVDFPGWRAEELWDGLHGRLCHPHPWDFKACWGKILSQCVGVESEPSRVPSHWGVSGSCELLYRYYKGLLFNRVYHCIFICYLCEPWMNLWKHEREKNPSNFCCLKWSIYFAVAAKVRGTVPSVLQHWPGFPAHWGRHWTETEMEQCQGIYGWSKSWENMGDSHKTWGKYKVAVRITRAVPGLQFLHHFRGVWCFILCRSDSRGDLWVRPRERKIRSPFRLWEGNCFSPLSLAWNAIPSREGWPGSSQGWARIRAGPGSASLGWFVLEEQGRAGTGFCRSNEAEKWSVKKDGCQWGGLGIVRVRGRFLTAQDRG